MAFTINQRAWESGMGMYDEQLRRERQAVIDKRAEEEWGFKKEDREKATKKERDLNAAYEAGIAAAESSAPDTSRVNQWLSAQTGAAPQQQAQPEVPQQASVVDGAGADQTAVANNAVVQAGVPGGVAAPVAKAPAVVNPERARAIQAMKMAQLTGSPQAYSQAQAQLDAVDKQAEYAALVTQAMKLSPEDRQRVVGTLDMNPGYKMSASLDPKTQITTLKLEDGGEVKLNQMQLARVLVGKYKIDKGDMTGVADIEAVDAKLAERIVKDNNALREVTSTNNQGVTQAANIEIARNQDARQGNQDGRAQTKSDQEAVVFAAQQKAVRDADLLKMAQGDFERARQAGDRQAMNSASVRIATLGGKTSDPDASSGVELKTDGGRHAYVIQKGKDGSAVIQKVDTAKGPMTIPSIGSVAREADKPRADPRSAAGRITDAGKAAVGSPSQADLEYTARKYGLTVDQVKQKLGNR